VLGSLFQYATHFHGRPLGIRGDERPLRCSRGRRGGVVGL
jgi:hypothetical protein